ncbi:MAG: hypothetical protein DYH13_11135 [Alphaproteobacteria bacterium PRO2]|nr:hypothetical protein [Alphaproteobacteria bacterium PRO2]
MSQETNTLKDRTGDRSFLNALFMTRSSWIDLGDSKIIISPQTAALIREEILTATHLHPALERK